MTLSEYIDECCRRSNVFDEKNQAVNNFLANNPDLGDDATYKRFWDLQNEAATAAKDWWEYCENNRSKVTR